MSDEFVPVPGYEGRYVINREGVVKSVPRLVAGFGGRNKKVKEQVIRVRPGGKYIVLRSVGGQKTLIIAKLLTQAFPDDNRL